jgi:hypothetical protein
MYPPTFVSVLFAAGIVCGCAELPADGPLSPMQRTTLDECDAANFDTPPMLVEGNRPDLWRNATALTVATVRFVVTPSGTADQISAETTGDWHMAGFAGLAVKDWKFEPARKAGVPVLAHCTVTMRYDVK